MKKIDKEESFFSISTGISKIINSFNHNNENELINEIDEKALSILKKWWTGYELTTVKFNGDIWSHRGKKNILRDASKLKIKKNENILDLGCGLGGPARILANEYGCNILGIDINEDAITIGNELSKLEKIDTLVKLKIGNRENIEYDDNSFDVIWEHAGFGNDEQRKKTIESSYKVLKEGGRFFSYGEQNNLELFVNTGFGEITFYPSNKKEREDNIQKFVDALEANKEEIVSRTGQKNYDLWYFPKLELLKKLRSSQYNKSGFFIAVK